MAKARDNQKQRLYNWETKYIKPTQGELLDSWACYSLMQEACADYGVRTPPLVYHQKSDHPYFKYHGATPEKDFVNIPYRDRYKWIVLHEVAHAINHQLNNDAAGHGPEYATIYFALLAKYHDFPKNRLISWAYVHGLSFKPF